MSRRSSFPPHLILAVTALLIGTAGLTAGCGSLAVGKGDFGCQGHPSAPMCLPASGVYELTNSQESRQDAPMESAADAKTLVHQAPARSRDNAFLGDDTALFALHTGPAPEWRAARHPPPASTETDAATVGRAEDLLLPRSRDPIPLRMPAQVMRIWLAPWEDRQSDLHASGFVFTEIVPKTWTLAAGPDRFSQALLKPLQMAQRADPGATPSTPGGLPPSNARRHP